MENKEQVTSFYLRTIALISNLAGGIDKFIPALLSFIEKDLQVDRIGIFVAISSGEHTSFVLRGVHGQHDQDLLYHEYLEINQIDFSGSVYIDPQPGVAWDAYLKIEDNDGNIVAVLALDDTSTARVFEQDQMEIIYYIIELFSKVFEHSGKIDEFRFIDPKLKILNYAGLIWESQRLLSEMRRKSEIKTALGFLDIDHFGQFNKTYGEQVGDLALKLFVDFLKSRMRQYDTLARFGGEEFVVIWVDRENGDQVVKLLKEKLERINADMAKLLIQYGDKRHVGLSFSGGVIEVNPENNIEKCFDQASELKNQAKQAGRKTILTF